MHDPQTVAHEIRSPFKNKHGHRPAIVTIWHVDPETDGTDSSCGWFARAQHGDQEIFEKVVKEFEFNFQHNYWFNEAGYPQFSTMGVTLNMYRAAAWIHFGQAKGRNKCDRFIAKHLHEILYFAENPVDTIGNSINMKYGVPDDKSGRPREFASIVYGDIVRKTRPWYKHPRWHIHHWKIQFHPFQQLKRRYWDKCSICGKRGFKGSAYSDWDGINIWHGECDRSAKVAPTPEANTTTP